MKRLSILFSLSLLLAACTAEVEHQESEVAMEANEMQMDWMEGAAASAMEVHPLLPGMQAASFTAKTKDGESFEFNPEARDKGAILIFYRGGWCPYCNRQLMKLREIDDDLVELGYDLFFVSADSPESLSEGAVEGEVPYTLISDNKMEVSKSFGIAFKVDDGTVERYMRAGLDIEAASGYKHHLLPAPSVFVVDSKGTIQFQYTNPYYSSRVDPDVLMAAARSASEVSD